MLGYESTPRVTAANFLCQHNTANALVRAAKEYLLLFDLL